jgi:WD40 repeat protein
MLIRQMIHKDVRKRPYTMGMVKQELQDLALQDLPPKKGRISRRTLLKLGGQLAGLGGLAAASSLLTWQVETQAHRQVPHPGYSPSLGGTIYTYDAQNSVLAVAWSPNGTRVAMGGWSNQVQAWDANTGHRVINFRDPGLQQRVEAIIWLPDGKSIVAGGDDSLVWIWNATTGNIQDIYRGHTNSVITLACSLDGQYIASGGLDQTVQVWKVATGQKNATYSGHSHGIGSVSWSPDGKYIASASFDRTVQVWEAATGHHVFTYTGHTDKVYAVAWSPNGQRIASGGHDLTVQVWPVPLFEKNGQRQERPIIYRGHTRAIQALAWSPDSRTIASAADNVQLWNGLTGKHIFTYKGHAISVPLEVQAVAWSPNGRYITSGGMEGTVQVWNAR